MKRVLLIMAFFFLFSCEDFDHYNSYKEIAILAWNRGWIAGANAVIDLNNYGILSEETVKMKLIEDSVNFEKGFRK